MCGLVFGCVVVCVCECGCVGACVVVCVCACVLVLYTAVAASLSEWGGRRVELWVGMGVWVCGCVGVWVVVRLCGCMCA